MGLAYIKNIQGEVICTEDDALNQSNYRNVNNIDYKDYNCGGWALNTFEWLVPFLSCGNIDDFSYYAETHDSEWIDNLHDFFRDEENCESSKNEVNDEIEKHNGNIEEQYYAHWDNETIINLSIQHLLSAFKDLRLINSLDELEDNEYGIVFGTNYDDFHFARILDGVITAKCGGCEIEEYYNIESAMINYPYGRTYFARKIQAGMDNNY